LDAIIFRGERLGLGKACPANRHPGDILKRLLAQAALIGKQTGEKGSGDRSNAEGH
jgi:hypothetical protein